MGGEEPSEVDDSDKALLDDGDDGEGQRGRRELLETCAHVVDCGRDSSCRQAGDQS